ncbi:holin-like protein; bacteriophage SPbeta [Bacillus altitudinis]|uniref:Holin-like protein bacteriophage SPbeta n=1 Tax=Bacillus altitudinis TaxID=293387 RepID=A0A653V6A3_BACAB|nr:holin-like protein; bacteriophage SPbeta [Bacillus altitudinis]
MVEMDLAQYLMTQGPFAVLFCWVLLYVLNTTKERESKLNEQIEAQNEVLAKFSEKYDVVIDKLDKIERNLK